jgi:putative membrane protein
VRLYFNYFDIPQFALPLEAALTFAMGMLVLFRINRAYERWWEARTLWGALVNASRNLAVKTRQLAQVDQADKQEMGRLIVGFCYVLKDHLRDQSQLSRVPGLADSTDPPEHLPSFIVQQIYGKLKGWIQAGALSREELWIIDSEARMLLEVCGSCERIKDTLMSRSWRLLTRQCLAVYLLVTPWALVEEFRYWTIPITALVAYFIIAAEGIAHYVEEPFGTQEDHLDLEDICSKIEKSVGEIIAS